MIKKGDTVIYSGETVKVMATPETVGSGDPKHYLIEGYSGGWYPSPGQPNGIYGVHTQKKYLWVTDSRYLLPVNSAPIAPGMYRILDTHNVRNYLRGKDVIGQLVTVSSKEAELLNEGRTVILDKNKWGINFVAGDLSRATDIPVESRYKVGERVIYNGSEALVARVDGGNMYVIQLFNGQGWLGEAPHAGLSPTAKYWAVAETELKPAPVQTKIPAETPYRVTLPRRSPHMVDPLHYGYGAFGSAGMMASMIDPYHDEKRAESSRVERTLLADMERDYQRQRVKRYYEDAAKFGMYFHTVLLSDLAEKNQAKPVTNQPPDAYIQQPIIVTKRKTKHSLTTV